MASNGQPLARPAHGAKKQSFLKGLREKGTVTAGCKIARINRRTAYRWRSDDETFSNLGGRKSDPCLEVGDLIIALESIDVQTFYTLNRKESLHFCRVLDQDLIIRPKKSGT